MKTFFILKLPILLCFFGAALIFSPTSRAQSEVAPDHFDDGSNTEPFDRGSKTIIPDTNKTSQKPVAALTRNRTSNPNQTKQLVAARNLSTPATQNAAVIEEKRKTATRKSNKQ